jgi:hypothetical protein
MIRNYCGRCGEWLTDRAALRLRHLYPLSDNSGSSSIFSTFERPRPALSRLVPIIRPTTDGTAQ